MGLCGSFVIPVQINTFENLQQPFSESITKKTSVNMIHKPFFEQSHAESVFIAYHCTEQEVLLLMDERLANWTN